MEGIKPPLQLNLPKRKNIQTPKKAIEMLYLDTKMWTCWIFQNVSSVQAEFKIMNLQFWIHPDCKFKTDCRSVATQHGDTKQLSELVDHGTFQFLEENTAFVCVLQAICDRKLQSLSVRKSLLLEVNKEKHWTRDVSAEENHSQLSHSWCRLCVEDGSGLRLCNRRGGLVKGCNYTKFSGIGWICMNSCNHNIGTDKCFWWTLNQ